MKLFFVGLLMLSTAIGCKKSSAPPDSVHGGGARTRIICFGDSLTTGYGLSEEKSYPGLIRARLKEKSLSFTVHAEAVNGITTAQGLQRLPDVLDKYPADEIRVFLLELGANDGFGQTPVEETQKNLEAMLEKLQKLKIPALLVGIKIVPVSVFGKDRFEGMFSSLQSRFQVALIPNLLEGVRFKPELNQSDGIHPNEEGMKIVFENIWKGLEAFI